MVILELETVISFRPITPPLKLASAETPTVLKSVLVKSMRIESLGRTNEEDWRENVRLEVDCTYAADIANWVNWLGTIPSMVMLQVSMSPLSTELVRVMKFC